MRCEWGVDGGVEGGVIGGVAELAEHGGCRSVRVNEV